MKRIKTGNVVVCEYVAQGAYSKFTIVNAYAGNITVREFPATFPLAFFIEIMPYAGMPRDIKFQVKIGKKVKAELSANFEFEAGKPALMLLPQLRLTFPKETTIQVVALGEGHIKTVLISKKVSAGQIPAG